MFIHFSLRILFISSNYKFYKAVKKFKKVKYFLHLFAVFYKEVKFNDISKDFIKLL